MKLYVRHHSTTVLVPLSAPRFAPGRGYREDVASNVLRIQVDESALVCLFYFALPNLTPPPPLSPTPTPLPLHQLTSLNQCCVQVCH